MPWLATTETNPRPHKTVIAKLHRTTVNDPHLEGKDIGLEDKPLHQLSCPKYLEPPPRSNTLQFIKCQHY